ncbi:hypothetical protein BH24DEI2_BH24DEI2_17310 [soil metagenome]
MQKTLRILALVVTVLLLASSCGGPETGPPDVATWDGAVWDRATWQ